jgi:hypothetical protein
MSIALSIICQIDREIIDEDQIRAIKVMNVFVGIRNIFH